MKYVFKVLMFRRNCEKDSTTGKKGEQLFTVSQEDPTDDLLIAKGIKTALQWRSLVEST